MIREWSASTKSAVIMATSGEQVTYQQIDWGSSRLARLLAAGGMQAGGHLAILMENHPRYFEVCWAGLRSGLYVTPINWHLKPEEAGYIIQDCGATAVVTSAALGSVAEELAPYLGTVTTRLVIDGDIGGFDRYEDAVGGFAAEPLADEHEGTFMFYSSGTTGVPKGIKRQLPGASFGAAPAPLVDRLRDRYEFSADSVYLCPAPLYHAAPLGWSTAVQRLGGSVVVMERFDAAWALELIERYRVTHAQFVPTHFVRMLKLDEQERRSHDISSLRAVVHAAAPCPVEVKERVIDWFGPIIHEYYAGSEANGTCAIRSVEWLSHKGSVGRPLGGIVHILDEDGGELPPGEAGQIWFETGATFEYHNDPEKTAGAFNDRGWSTLGDIGHLDNEGYLYLTDRASHMIISGGVNIYPQEVEDLLIVHPAVADAAVIGVPDADMGEQVKAVIQPVNAGAAGAALAGELLAYCRDHLASYKCPRSVDFVESLPRLPTGKLLKRELRLRYWPAP